MASTITVREKGRISRDLHKLTAKTYFDAIPVNSIDEILRANGYLLVCEDGTPFSAIFCGNEGRATIDIGYVSSIVMAGDVAKFSMSKSALAMTWYRMPSGRYEIVAYLC